MVGTEDVIKGTVEESVDASKEIATSGTEVGLEVDENELSRVKAMSLKQIDEYGSTIQDMIGSKSTAILQKATVNDTGATMKKAWMIFRRLWISREKCFLQVNLL